MSPQRVILLFTLLYFFYVTDFKAKAILTMVKTRRTQSMRPLTSYKRENNIHTKPLSNSRSSSASSLTEIKATDRQPIPSTSTGKRIDTASLQEVDHRPLLEKTKHVGFVDLPNLNEASVSTHRNGDINPSRDGVYSRVRSAFLGFGAAVAVGSAIGVGGVVIDRHFIHNNNSATENISVNKTFQQLFDDDEISNLIETN